jgi:hypothetical protein
MIDVEEDDPVLVVLLKSPRDLEIAETEHWYRMPVRHAPPHIGRACYLAFYLTQAFGERKWSIREYAALRGHELVRRRDVLPDEGDHVRADEVYYKLQLGPMISLPRPIVSRSGRRLLYVWTTGGRFSKAVEINDLFHKSDADDALWKRLVSAGLGAERQIVVRDARARYRVDFWIPCLLGNVALVLANSTRRLPRGPTWRSLRLSEAEVLEKGEESWNKLLGFVRELGGAKYACTE